MTKSHIIHFSSLRWLCTELRALAAAQSKNNLPNFEFFRRRMKLRRDQNPAKSEPKWNSITNLDIKCRTLTSNYIFNKLSTIIRSSKCSSHDKIDLFGPVLLNLSTICCWCGCCFCCCCCCYCGFCCCSVNPLAWDSWDGSEYLTHNKFINGKYK